ncbi:MAG TPA: molybdopterin-dependent oxidoreductase [Candidatus Eisenbacteria bacterium]|nr:molybdopterin-dependent oxidoreductase [Candidatus Eisenbacteria bacterium]
MANITIDGKALTVKDGITIIEAIDQAQIGLPRYCYHPGLSIAGNCRICQVEVEKMPRTVIACNTRVAEGMVIHTKTEKAKESQQVVLEFLLANHPLDCPVCDQAGECKLQDYYMDYGLYDPKFNDVKVKKEKKAVSVGPTIMLDQERCILCTRCVRFGDEVTKTHDFGVFNRGDHSELDIYPGKELNNKYSGNVADICPVGALTDKDFRFKMRVWYLGSQDSVCPGCSRGCNIQIHYEKSRPYHLKTERVMRLKPRENQDVNKWWMCDEGRYGYKPIDKNRLQKIRISRSTNGSDPSWLMALEKTATVLRAAKPGAWGVLASPQSTNEELHLVKKIFKDLLKIEQVAFFAPGQEGFEDDFLLKKDKNPNSAGAAEILKVPGGGDLTPVVEAAKAGKLEGLFIFSHDLAKIYGAETLAAVRKAVKTVVYEGPNENPTAEAADVLLPSSSYAEKDGTFTNFEGRVQRIRRAVDPLGVSRPTWQILADLGALLGAPWNYTRAEHVFNDLAKENAAFKDMNYKAVGSSGLLWSRK